MRAKLASSKILLSTYTIGFSRVVLSCTVLPNIVGCIWARLAVYIKATIGADGSQEGTPAMSSNRLLSICVITLLSSPLFASSVEITDIQTFSIPFGDTVTTVAINDSGDIAGTSLSGGTNQAGFVIPANGSAPFQITYPGASGTYVGGINNQDTVVGYALTGITYVGFTYNGGSFNTLAVGRFTYASGIDNHGDVTGYFGTLDESATGFLIRNGVLYNFSVPGYPYSTFPVAVNDSGQVVGYYYFTLGGGFLRNADGSLQTFDFPAAGINNAGVIVGTGAGPDDSAEGRLRVDNANYAYMFPGAVDTYLDGINNLDEVVGVYNDPGNAEGIFEGRLVLVTTPEPSNLSFCLLGLIVLSVGAYSRAFRLHR
jgi:hypothetical protein